MEMAWASSSSAAEVASSRSLAAAAVAERPMLESPEVGVSAAMDAVTAGAAAWGRARGWGREHGAWERGAEAAQDSKVS